MIKYISIKKYGSRYITALKFNNDIMNTIRYTTLLIVLIGIFLINQNLRTKNNPSSQEP